MKYIAVIEDDIPIGDMLEEILKKEGYGVMRAYSGTEALLLLAQKQPDLVLLDLMLPGLSGEEVLPKLDGLPVIVVSAKAGVDDKVNLLLDGAADYITKPFETRNCWRGSQYSLGIRSAVVKMRCLSMTASASIPPPIRSLQTACPCV